MKNSASSDDMVIETMSFEDGAFVASMFAEVAVHIKEETQDVYFNFDADAATKMEDDLRSRLENDDSLTLVAKKDGELLGFITGEIIGCFFPFSPIKKVGYICGAYVVPSVRGKGIMKLLEAALLEHFRQKGVQYAELHCMSGNTHARKTWEALGYSTFREQMRKEIR